MYFSIQKKIAHEEILRGKTDKPSSLSEAEGFDEKDMENDYKNLGISQKHRAILSLLRLPKRYDFDEFLSYSDCMEH
jgi:hypothetical protein